VALDRQSIEKKDFPLGRRGYDPEAVDAHLSALAVEIDEFKSSARRRTDTLASSASDQVRAIVEAAENSANDITREAENEAREIRDEATSEAQATRDRAAEEAREYVGKVSGSTNSMLERLEAMEQELGGLIDSLRAGANRLTSDLQLLESNLSDVSGALLPPRPQFEPEAGAGHEPGPDGLPGYEPSSAGEEPIPEAAELHEVAGEPEYAHDSESIAEGDDAEGARLIALNMALNGTPREETARYLSENFQLSDAGGLLDEVYASVEG
jgi:DivIVA domain-containing protein